MMQEYTKVDDLLDDLHQIISECKTGSIFGGKTLDKEDVFDILEEIRYNLPRELKEAKKIIDNTDKILQDAGIEATKIIRQAEDEANKMISDHRITKIAKEEEEIKRSEVNEFVLQMREGAINYADGCLIDVESILQEALKNINYISKDLEDKLTTEVDKIYDNRQRMREETLY